MSRRRGFSLLEMMFSVGLFGLLMVMVFAFFEFGTRSFYLSTMRQGVQSDALRVITGLQKELKRTNRGTVSSADRTNAIINKDRDAVSVGGLQDWSDRSNGNNFDLNSGLPKWNRYVIYYATVGPEKGTIYRLSVDPNPPPEAPTPIDPLVLQSTINDDPNSNLFDGANPAYVLLSENVEEFKVILDQPEPGHCEIRLRLSSRRPPRPGGNADSEEETYEIVTSVATENSYPEEF